MSTSVKSLVEIFDQLSESERHEALIEILRRSESMEYGPLDDDALSRIADESFLEYDRRRAADAQG